MRCKDFKAGFNERGLDQLSEEELSHLHSCSNCAKAVSLATAALKKLDLTQFPTFNPYFPEKVMAAISRRQSRPENAKLRYALSFTVMLAIIIGGLTVYIAFKSNHHQAQQYDLLSLNDFPQSPIVLDKE